MAAVLWESRHSGEGGGGGGRKGKWGRREGIGENKKWNEENIEAKGGTTEEEIKWREELKGKLKKARCGRRKQTEARSGMTKEKEEGSVKEKK